MREDKHDQHQTLTEAILARDPARASELMRQHLLTPTPIIQQAMSGKLLLEKLYGQVKLDTFFSTISS